MCWCYKRHLFWWEQYSHSMCTALPKVSSLHIFSERPCGSIPAVANAAFEGRSKEKYEPGETIRYQCHEGFQVTGPPEIFCRRGNWSTPSICEGIGCTSK
uniref:Sushi domain-containing protein n=1 Tax=Anas platyrhynchos platyrhynchos TaxID=8840 RepID=A0A493U269_ANAPP